MQRSPGRGKVRACPRESGGMRAIRVGWMAYLAVTQRSPLRERIKPCPEPVEGVRVNPTPLNSHPPAHPHPPPSPPLLHNPPRLHDLVPQPANRVHVSLAAVAGRAKQHQVAILVAAAVRFRQLVVHFQVVQPAIRAARTRSPGRIRRHGRQGISALRSTAAWVRRASPCAASQTWAWTQGRAGCTAGMAGRGGRTRGLPRLQAVGFRDAGDRR